MAFGHRAGEWWANWTSGRSKRFKIWMGMGFGSWLKLLLHNRFAVSPGNIHHFVIITIASLSNSLLHFVQEIILGRKISGTVVDQDPVFIIGHWRSGTTLLHEMLALDERHSFPNTYQCINPNHFLLTEKLYTRIAPISSNDRRPMDNMPLGWERPQEDEFALCNMGVGSPYLTMAFPNHPPQCQEYFTLEKLAPEVRRKWESTLYRFLQAVTLKRKGRIILKSPTHTFRIGTLIKMFPKARFIHIVRNPYRVFPSTMKTWKALYAVYGLQKPNFANLEEYVFSKFELLYDRVEQGRTLLPPGQFCEVRYEDLVRDPEGELEKIYQSLDLGEFDKVLPHLRQFLAERADYRPNTFSMSPELQNGIESRWGKVIKRYGYEFEG